MQRGVPAAPPRLRRTRPTSHARFATRDDRWYIEPLGSTNATFVDGVVVQGPRALDSGETVMLGRTQFVFKILD